MYRSPSKTKSLIFSFLLTLILSCQIFAGKQQLVDSVIEVSGINDQFSTFDTVMNDTLGRMLATNSELNTDEKEVVKNIILKDLSQASIINSIKKVVDSNMTEDELKTVLSSYQLEIMQKVKQANLKNAQPDIQQDFMNFAMNIDKNPPSANRLKLVKKLDEVLQASKFQAQLMGNMLESMMTSFNQIDNKLSKEKLKQTVNNVNMFMKEAAKEQIKMMYLFTFKDFSDEDLELYIKVEESEASLLALNNNLFNGVTDFFNGYSKSVGIELAKFADAHKKAIA